MENSMEVPQNIKNTTSIQFNISTPGYLFEETKILIWKDMCIPMFIAVLFTIAKLFKQSKCPSTDEWLKKNWYLYTMEY